MKPRVLHPRLGFRPLAAACLGGIVFSWAAAPCALAQSAPTFRNVSVHDPSVVRVSGAYYVFGSHLAAAGSINLISWTGLSSASLVPDPATTFAEAIAWAGAANHWAPDVHQLPDGKFYLYYCVTAGDSPRSALGVAVSDSVAGPYVHQEILLRSGMWGQTSPDGTIYDATKHPNAVDPQVFLDALGRRWMVYGSYSGGIFILQLDPATGRPLPGQGYGKKLIGKNHSRIEAPYILHQPGTGYYYLFLSFGGLDSDGGYQIRAGRSLNPDGPFLDPSGVNLTNVGGPTGSFFDDAAIAPHGAKLIGNYQFLHVDGEPRTTSRGYLSPGHNSAYHDAATGRTFLFFHTRFVDRGEAHEVRVHQLYFNESGWPVVAPHRFAGETLAPFSAGQIPGEFKLINFAKDIAATVHTSVPVTLAADGTVSGGASGTWALTGENFARLVLGGVTYRGVFSRQWDDENRVWVLAFSALSDGGVSVWGSKVAAANVVPTLAPIASRTLQQGEPLQLTAAGSDLDVGQTLTYSLVTAPFGATIHPATGAIAWSPLLAHVGEAHEFTVRVVDNGANPGAAETSFTVTVEAVTDVRRTRLDFGSAASAGLRDGAGVFTGLTTRLPGTGSSAPVNDPLLALNTTGGFLAFTSSQADFNGGAGLSVNRSAGLALSSLGFTGAQDFAATAVFRALPAFGVVDQAGLFVGANGATLTRAGAILFGTSPEGYAVHTQGGVDQAARFAGPLTGGDGMTVTIQRVGGIWRYLVDGTEWNPQTGGSKTEPAFLAGRADLTAGVFAITPFNTNPKTVNLESFTLLVDHGPTLLQSWRQLHFSTPLATGDAADLADPDADGLPNLLEYALGAAPRQASAAAAPRANLQGPASGRRLALVFDRIADPSLLYEVEAAGDPGGPWDTIWSSTGSENLAGAVTVEDTTTPALGVVTRRFLRLRVTR